MDIERARNLKKELVEFREKVDQQQPTRQPEVEVPVADRFNAIGERIDSLSTDHIKNALGTTASEYLNGGLTLHLKSQYTVYMDEDRPRSLFGVTATWYADGQSQLVKESLFIGGLKDESEANRILGLLEESVAAFETHRANQVAVANA